MESYLSSPHMLILPQINWILNSSLRNKVQKRANEVIVSIYRQLYQCVHDPVNQYQNPTSLMPHSVEEVESTLLLCLEANDEPIQI